MTWRNIVTHWLSDKIITQEGNLETLDLMKLLIEKNIIPATLIDNPTLHAIILTQIILGSINEYNGTSGPPGKHLYLPYERERNDDVRHGYKKRKADRGIGKRNGGEFGSLSQTEH